MQEFSKLIFINLSFNLNNPSAWWLQSWKVWTWPPPASPAFPYLMSPCLLSTGFFQTSPHRTHALSLTPGLLHLCIFLPGTSSSTSSLSCSCLPLLQISAQISHSQNPQMMSGLLGIALMAPSIFAPSTAHSWGVEEPGDLPPTGP